MDIYLDTNLWNALTDQAVEPAAFLQRLTARNARLILSDESVYELAKTFAGANEGALARGAKLFSPLKAYAEGGIPVTKDNMALLASEMQALQWCMSYINPFLTPEDREQALTSIEQAARCNLSDHAKRHIQRRAEMLKSLRGGISAHFKNQPPLQRLLKDVSLERLPEWLQRELDTPSAVEYLTWQIHDYFPERSRDEASEYAHALLRSTHTRVARALTKRNSYFNWRCAHRGSIPADLFADTTHVINASYCDVYATKESGQKEYAELLLTTATKVAIYDGTTPIDRWLLEQSERH